jgi:hypothetical protein
MIADILHDAAEEIRDSLVEYGLETYGNLAREIMCTIAMMETLSTRIDNMGSVVERLANEVTIMKEAVTITTMKLVRTNFHTRWPCDVCGCHTEKVSILCEGVVGDRLIRCCETCLEEGQEQIDKFLRSHAYRISAHAQFVAGLIGRLKIPSFAEYQAATKEVDEEFKREFAAHDHDGDAPAAPALPKTTFREHGNV